MDLLSFLELCGVVFYVNHETKSIRFPQKRTRTKNTKNITHTLLTVQHRMHTEKKGIEEIIKNNILDIPLTEESFFFLQ